MNLNQVTTEALKEVLDTIKDSKGFVKEQAPDLAKEILLEAKVGNIFSAVICVPILLASVGYLIHLLGIEGDLKGTQFALMIASIVVGIFSFIGTMCTISEIISITTAPKLYILKRLAGAINRRE